LTLEWVPKLLGWVQRIVGDGLRMRWIRPSEGLNRNGNEMRIEREKGGDE